MSPPPPDAALEETLDFLRRMRGLDLTGYKRPSLERRFQRRMEAVGASGYEEYLDRLEVEPSEYKALLDVLLINVTEFFRDPPVWDALRERILPELLAAKGDEAPIRLWSAGCASGEEAYSIAMVLADLLGEEAMRRRVKIYATDVDEPALEEARRGVYAEKQLEHVPPDVRERHFTAVDGRAAVSQRLRRSVIFGRNDLVQDAPISRLDLVLCRNTLMYFTADTQRQILRNFAFALADGGLLVLGRSELLIFHREHFAPADVGNRIFHRRPRAQVDRRADAPLPEPLALDVDEDRAARDAALDAHAQAVLIVSRGGVLTFANAAARALLSIAPDDVGRPLHQLPVAHRPLALGPPIERAIAERRRLDLGDVAHRAPGGEAQRLDVAAIPLRAGGEMAIAAAVVFEDVTRVAHLQTELDDSRRDLELAQEELQATIDELEATNEELQSANEELQTTNEELESTNEELETMNEELLSTNEELETINDENRLHADAMHRANGFLEAILSSLHLGVAVLDRRHEVVLWNRRAEELWGVRPEEATGQPFLSLDIGLPAGRLAAPLRAVTGRAGGAERLAVDAVNRRGRPIVCQVTVLPLLGAEGADLPVQGAIVLMDERSAADGARDGGG